MAEEEKGAGLNSKSFSTATLNQIFTQIRPHQFTSSPTVDSEIQKVVTLLIRDYISSWFSNISINDEFLSEIVRALAHIMNECERRLHRIDWVALVSRDVVEAIKNHIIDFQACCDKMGTAYAGGHTFEELFHGCQPHIALNDEASEKAYLRRVAEVLVDVLLPEHELKSDCVRLLLREILMTYVLCSLIDILADPDYLNQLFLRVLEPEDSVETGTADNAESSIPANAQQSSIDALQTSLQGAKADSFFEQSTHESYDHQFDSYAGDKKRTLFQIKDDSGPFARRRGRQQQTTNPLMKITMEGLGRVSNSIDKFRSMVSSSRDGFANDSLERGKRMRRFLRKKDKGYPELDKDFEDSDVQMKTLYTHKNEPTKKNRRQVIVDGEAQQIPSSTKLINNANKENPSNSSVHTVSGDEGNLTSADTNTTGNETLSPALTDNVSPSYTHESQEHTTPSSDGSQLQQQEAKGEGPKDEPIAPEVRLYGQIKELCSFIYSVYKETKSGPWHLGPIDTTKYDRYHLDEPMMDLFNEAFQVQAQQKWVFTQFVFFLKPLVHGVAGAFVNRLVMKAIYFFICEEQVANYLLLFRLSFWPNNQLSTAYVTRSEQEKQETKVELEMALVNLLLPILSPLLGSDFAEDRIRFLLNILQNRMANKHFLYITLDLILAHLAPEFAEARAVQLT